MVVFRWPCWGQRERKGHPRSTDMRKAHTWEQQWSVATWFPINVRAAHVRLEKEPDTQVVIWNLTLQRQHSAVRLCFGEHFQQLGARWLQGVRSAGREPREVAGNTGCLRNDETLYEHTDSMEYFLEVEKYLEIKWVIRWGYEVVRKKKEAKRNAASSIWRAPKRIRAK